MIYFRCRNCGALIKVSDRFAGKKGKCAKCGATNDIPAESEHPPATAKSKPAPPAGPHAEPAAAPAAGAPAPPESPRPQAEKPAARAEEEPAAEQRPRAAAAELPVPARQIDQLIAHLRQQGGPGLFSAVEQVAYVASVYAVLALGPFMILVGLSVLPGKTSVDWTKADQIQTCLTLVVGGLLLPLCQYVIAKVRTASVKVVQSSPSVVSSTNLLDCLAVLLLVGGVVALGGGAYLGYRTHAWGPGTIYGVGGLVACFLCFLLAGVAINPSELNILVAPKATAGQEAVGFLSFCWKVLLRFAPVILVIQLCASLAMLGWAAHQSVGNESVQVLAMSATTVCLGLIVFAAAYVLVYLLFLAYHLLVDLIMAMFQIAVNTRLRERARRPEKVEDN